MKKRRTGITRKLKKMTRFLLRASYIVCVLGVVFLGVYSSLGRYYIPKVEENQDYLIKEIQSFTNESIYVGGLSGSWSGLTPTVTFKDVSLVRDFGLLKIKNIEVEVDFFRSILKRKAVFKNLHISGSYIEINNSEELLEKDKTSSDFNFVPEEIIKVVEGFTSASIEDSSLNLLFKDGGHTEINNISMKIQKKVNSQLVFLQADFANTGKIQGGVVLNSSLQSSANKASGWLKVNGGDLLVFKPLTDKLGLDPLPNDMQSEVWFDWRKNYHFKFQGDVLVPELKIPSVSRESLKNITNIKSHFYFNLINGQDPELWIKKVNFNWYGVDKAFSEFFVRADNIASPNKLSVYFPSLSLTYFSQLFKEYPLSDELKSIASDLSPEGYLTDLNIDIDLLNKNDPVTIRANLKNASIDSWKGAPGAKGVNGYVEAKKSTGFVELDTNDISLSFPKLYKEPLFFEKAKARVHWNIEGKRVSVFSDLIQASGDFGNAQGKLALDLPIADGSYEPTMYLAIGFKNINAKYRMRYIPMIIDEGLYDWISKSVKYGEAIKGGFVYRGSIEPNHSGYQTFQFFSDVEGVELDYQPPWPRLSNASGKLVINDTTVKVKADSADVYDSKIQKGIVNVAKNNDVIELTGIGLGDFLSFDVVKLLQESPIAEMTHHAFDSWYAKGNATANFSLYIPFSEKIKPEVSVAGRIENTELRLPVNNLTIKNINGPISYSLQKGLTSENITGVIFDHKLSVDMLVKEKYGRKIQEINFVGNASINALNDWLDQPVFRFMKGDTGFYGKVLIDNAVTIQTNLDLQGSNIDLPEPLGKKSSDIWNVNVNAIVKDGNIFVDLKHENAFSLSLNWSGGLLSHGGIFLGDQLKSTVKTWEPKFITVSGHLPEASLDEWMPLITHYNDHYSQPIKPENNTIKPEDDASFSFQVKDLKIDNANAFSLQADSLNVSMVDTALAWDVYLESPAAKGIVSLMKDNTLASKVDFSYLSLQAPFLKPPIVKASLDNDQSKKEKLLDDTVVGESNKAIPMVELQSEKEMDTNFSEKLNVHIKKLMLNNVDAGDWAMLVNPDEKKVNVESIKANSTYVNVSGIEGLGGVLSWSKSKGEAITSFDGTINAKSLRRFLNKWGYDIPVEAESSAFVINVNWPGTVQDFSVKKITGTISLKIQNGGFKTLNSSGTNFLKTIGVLNVSELLRRLRFDFSDVTDKGFSFDEVTGVLSFNNGELSLLRPLYVLSPSSELRFTGDIDLMTESLKMNVVATLPVNNNLPWIAALAGGLPVAAGVFVVSKVMEKQVNQLSSAVYDISGKWSDPKVKFSRLFDAGRDGK